MKISRCSVCLLTGSELIPPRPCFCIGHCAPAAPVVASLAPLALGGLPLGPLLVVRRSRARSPRAPTRNSAISEMENPKSKDEAQFETSAPCSRRTHTYRNMQQSGTLCRKLRQHRSTTRPPTVVRLCDHSTRNHDKETANSSPLYGRMGLSCARGMSPPRSLTHAPRSPAHRPRRPTAACRRPLSRTT